MTRGSSDARFRFLSVCAWWFAFGTTAHALDMTGAWAKSATACGKIFVKQGNRISFARGADRHGIGFILEGNRIRGRVATCKINWRKEEGAHFVATCSRTVIDTVQLALKVIDDNTIGRVLPGESELEIYERCLL